MEGTWQISYVIVNGSKFTVAELEAVGDYYSSDMYMILKEGGAAVEIAEGTAHCYVWSMDGKSIDVNGIEMTLSDDGMTFTAQIYENILVYEKISDSQDITDVLESQDTD